ncbi:MAG: hypothetical protein HOE90_16150 [Bacteriovoracaceae bacterium]|jgi:hypothetical protein|nr:hypothetical protein [Bacteriovoracaceae bacterium]
MNAAKTLALCALMTTFSTTAFSAEGDEKYLELDCNGKTGTRIEIREDKDDRGRVALHIACGATFYYGGGSVAIKTQTGTGGAFNGGYFTVIEGAEGEDGTYQINPAEGATDSIPFSMRYLYGETRNDLPGINSSITGQFGFMPVTKGLAKITAKDGMGWVDGARVIFEHNKYGQIELAVGAIAGVEGITESDAVSIFSRSKQYQDSFVNFIEVRATPAVIADIVATEFGYEYLGGDVDLSHNFSAAATADFKVVKLLAEGLVSTNWESVAVTAAGGAKVDLLEILSNNKKSGVTLGLYYQYNEGSMRSNLSSGFYNIDGHSLQPELGVKLGDSGMTLKVKGSIGLAGLAGAPAAPSTLRVEISGKLPESKRIRLARKAREAAEAKE